MIPKTEAAWILLALVVAWMTVCFRLGTLPLLQPDEGRNAEVAREMKLSGAWLVPTYNGIDYLDKPAFYFKAVALSLAAFGDSETAARIPSAAFGLGLLGLAYLFCRREHGFRCAALAVMAVVSMPLFLVNARTVIFDIALAFFTSAAIFAGYRAEASEGNARRGWYLVGAAAAGLATLVKGPVGFLIPTLVLFVFHRIENRKGVVKRYFAPLNLLVFFGVTLPWFIGLSLAHRDFPYYGLVEESFHRFTTASFHRTQPFYFYLLIVVGMFFPWSLLLPEAGMAAWKLRWTKTRAADRLCIVWAVVVVIFFSLSHSKLPGYILSVTVACGILVARLFDMALTNPDGKAALIVRRAAIGFAVVCLVAVIAVAVLAPLAHSQAGRLGIPVAEADELGRHIAAPIILFLVFAAAGLFARYRRDVSLCFACFALFPFLLTNVNLGKIELVFDGKSARKLAQQMPTLPPDTELAFVKCFPNGLPFYLGRTGTLITKDGNELTSNYILFCLKSAQVWPTNVVPFDGLDQWLAGRNHAVYLIARANGQDQPVLQAIATKRGAPVQQLTPLYLGVLLPAP